MVFRYVPIKSRRGSNTNTIVVEWQTAGVKIITVNYLNIYGCSALTASSFTVTVNEAPISNFSADVACKGGETQFTDLSTTPSPGSVVSWYWNFNDAGSNITSDEQNPIYIFNTEGPHPVTLTVTNNFTCAKDSTIIIEVFPSPIADFEFTLACDSSNTSFTNLSIFPGSGNKRWLWNFDDPYCTLANDTSSVKNPIHMFSYPGTYHVKLKAWNLNGCTDSITLPVLVKPRPKADFTYLSKYCPAGEVILTDLTTTSSSSIQSRQWTVSGTTYLTPYTTYTLPSQNTNATTAVLLKVFDINGCEDTITKNIFVNPAFQLGIHADTACLGGTTHLYATNPSSAKADSLYNIKWDFGDPDSGPFNSSTLWGPTHNFTGLGPFTVLLTAMNSNGCVQTVSQKVYMVQGPAANFTFQQIPHCNLTDSVAFYYKLDSLGKGVDSIYWQIGTDQTLTNTWDASKKPLSGNKKLKFASFGTYYVTMKVINVNKCESIVTKLFNMNCITASFSMASSIACDSVPVKFTDNSTEASLIQSWQWDFGDTAVVAPYNPPKRPIVYHTYRYPGQYIVTLTITNGSVSDIYTMPITVNPSPKAILSVNNIGVCLGDSIEFTNKSVAGIDSTYTWNFKGVGHATDPLANPVVYYYDKAGKYKPNLIITTNLGCTDTSSTNVSVFTLPIAKIKPFNACIGQETQFIDGSTTGSGTINHWYWVVTNPGNQIFDTAQNFSSVFDQLGENSAQLIVTDINGCVDDTIIQSFTVKPSPVSNFTFVDQPNFGTPWPTNNKPKKNDETWELVFTNESEGAESYLWDIGKGPSYFEQNPTIRIDNLYNEGDTILIKLTSMNHEGCVDTYIDTFCLIYKGLYIPNAFSPSNPKEGVHLLKPVGVGIDLYLFEVFDRWGNFVWSTDKVDALGSPTEGWDGKDEGADMPMGTYVWKASAIFKDGTVWIGNNISKQENVSTHAFGTFTLIR